MTIDNEYEKLKRKSLDNTMSMSVKDAVRYFELKEKYGNRIGNKKEQHHQGAMEKSGEHITSRGKSSKR
jgi:hypothetical protein